MSFDTQTDRRNASDRVLLAEFVATRDEASFAELVRRHGPLVQAVCRQLLHDANDVDDAVQATFLVLARRALRIRQRDRLASWLYGVAYRVARRIRRRQPLSLHELSTSQTALAADPLEELTRRYDSEAVVREVYRLPASLREPILMRYMSGCSHREIARHLNISPAAVDGRLKRARRKLRLQLARQGISLGLALAVLHRACRGVAADPAWIHRTLGNCTTSPSGRPTPGHLEHSLFVDFATREMTAMALSNMTKWLGMALTATCGVVVTGVMLYTSNRPAWGGPGEDSVVTLLAAESSPAADSPTTRVIGAPQAATDPFNQNAKPTGPELTAQQTPPSAAAPMDVKYRSASERHIEAVMDEPTTLQFVDAPLGTVIEHLAQMHGIQIELDPEAQQAGISSDSPVTMNISELPLRDALYVGIERPLQLQSVVSHGVLYLTTPEIAENMIEVRVYPYRAEWTMSGQELARQIPAVVQPESWIQNGGPSTIVAYAYGHSNGGIIINANPMIHRKVADFIRQLMRAAESQVPLPLPSTGPNSTASP